MQREEYNMRFSSCTSVWLVEEGNRHAKLSWVSQVIGGHGLEGAWIKLTNLLAMGLSKWGQGDSVCLKKCNPQANKSWRMGLMNPCLERVEWELSWAGLGITPVQLRRGLTMKSHLEVATEIT